MNEQKVPRNHRVESIEDLKEQIHTIHRTVIALQDVVINYTKLFKNILLEKGIVMGDGVLHGEDVGILDIVNYVRRALNLYNLKGITHFRHGGVEFDLVLIGETLRGWKRVVSVEFKESDFAKAVSQALNRKDYAHYSAVVIGLSPTTVIDGFWDTFTRAKENGIGVISVTGFPDKYGIVLTKPKFSKPRYDIYDVVYHKWEELSARQESIVDYLPADAGATGAKEVEE